MAVAAGQIVDLMRGARPVQALPAAMALHAHRVLLADRGIGSAREGHDVGLAGQVREMPRAWAVAGFTAPGGDTAVCRRTERAGM